MSEPPLFSVIIPTWNRPELLATAIGSVLDQDFSDWELIVVDDGSEPPVEEVVNRFPDTRIHYNYQQNQGLGATRQRGAEMASGILLCYLDDDDYLLPNHLSIAHQAFEEQDRKLLLYKTGMIAESETGSRRRGELFDNQLGALQQHWEQGEGIFPYLIPRDLALREPSHNYFLSEDFNWIGRLMLQVPVYQINAYTVVCRQHPHNRTNVLIDDRALAARIAAVQDLYSFPGMAEAISRRSYRRMLAHQYWHWSRQVLRKSDAKRALPAILKGMAYLDFGNFRELFYTIFICLRTRLK